MKITVHEKEPVIIVSELAHLDEIISNSVERAKGEGFLSLILLNDDGDNQLGLVVGGDETVLSFTYSHSNPPYYASKGKLNTDEPVLTCFLLFEHHTEFSRKQVIPFNYGVSACHEFFKSGNLPSCIEWIEV
jgi:hypothetical protein